MGDLTDRFRFTILNRVNDRIDANNWKFAGADRVLMDRLITIMCEQHRHSGRPILLESPEPPKVQAEVTGGVLLPNKNVHYLYALVDQNGGEQPASQPAVVPTAVQLLQPQAPSITARQGTLQAGTYVYSVSFYTGTPDQETGASAETSGGLTTYGGFTILRPNPPNGVVGWNLYRRGPTDLTALLIKSSLINVLSIDDTGLLKANKYHKRPTANRSFFSNSVVVDLPSGLPSGHTVKIYRSYDSGKWVDSFVDWVSVLPFRDDGHPTKVGSPIFTGAVTAGAPKIRLTNASDVTGAASSRFLTFSTSATFNIPVPLTGLLGPYVWVNEYDRADVTSLRATLGRGSSPASEDLIVSFDVKRTTATTWEPFQIYDPNLEQFARLEVWITPGETTGLTRTTDLPASAPERPRALHKGDLIRPVVQQSGGGATPTDLDLTIAINLHARLETGS